MRKPINWIKQLNWKPILAYSGLFALVFVIFLYLTFPFDAVTNTLIQKLESQGKFRVEIKELSPFRLTGVKVTGLQLRDAEDPRKVFLDLEDVRVRLRPTQLLRGRLWVDFDVYLYGGGVAGSLCRHGGVVDLAFNFVDLDLTGYKTREVARQVGQFDLGGILSGDMTASINSQVRRNNQGSLNLNLDKLRVMNIDVLGKKFPDLTFEPGRVSFALNRQNFNVKEFALKGNHVELDVGGNVFVNETNLGRSRANLTVKFKPSEAFEDALGVLAFGLGSADDEGYYTYKINRTLGLGS